MLLSERALDIPPEVRIEDDPLEMIRFWISDGFDHVNLKIGTCDPIEEEPEMWGAILADIAKHAIRGLQQDDPAHGTTTELLARIELAFRRRLDENPSLSGQLQGSKN